MELSNEELRSIALGKFTARKCPSCDNNGIEYWDGNTGLGAGPNPPKDIPKEDVSFGSCENCNGIGYILQIQYCSK